MQVFSYAKLNLFLHITGKRDDGYHNLQTLFCRINFADSLYFTTDDGGIITNNPFVRLSCDNLTANINDNLIVKTANHLLEFCNQYNIGKPKPIHIILDKKIPTGAGLGGGSSNAAATLCTLNRLWELNLNNTTLIQIAKKLGADVPFFVLDTAYAIGEGIGEILTPVALPALDFLLLFPASHNSTQSFFGNPALKKDSPIFSHHKILTQSDDFLYKLNPPFFNAFQDIALTDQNIATAYHYLSTLTPTSTARLTGTGSTVFLPLINTTPQTLQQWQNKAPCPTQITQTQLSTQYQ